MEALPAAVLHQATGAGNTSAEEFKDVNIKQEESAGSLQMSDTRRNVGFYSANGHPSLAEAVLVAALVLHGAEDDERQSWLKILTQEEENYKEKSQREKEMMVSCGKAMQQICDLDVEPTVDAIRSYLAKLLNRKLHYTNEDGVRTLRSPWIFMEAARVMSMLQPAVRGRGRRPEASQGAESRWILKEDLCELKSALQTVKVESRNLKAELEATRTKRALAEARAEKAESQLALARSQLDVVETSLRDQCSLVAQYKAQAAPEVRMLKRELESLRIKEQLASHRAEKSGVLAGKARSMTDIASKQASEAHEQACQAMEAMHMLQVEMSGLQAENDHLRERLSRKHTASLTEQLKEQQLQLEQLRERKANNMGAMRQLNLERRRCKVLGAQVEELRKTLRDNWGRETLQQAEAGALVPRLQAEIACLMQALAYAEQEVAMLQRVICPPKPMASGSYDMKLRFTIMKLIACANLCHTHVPTVLELTAAHYNISLPGRYRKVLASCVNGVRSYVTKWKTWLPCQNTCENIRCEMGPLSQIQVGEYIIAHGGSEGNFALHMDAASSEGRELSAFVLGHRPIVEAGEPSVVNNLLLDLKWAMDKTSATRAKDFQGICKSVAELCKKADLEHTERIAELCPSATMTDRANAERCAARMLVGDGHVNPTCGEHGAVVNPTTACTKAMDKVVLGWMGKTDIDAKLDEHKVRALHMAVGWNNSPSGALIYCTCKYGAAYSDKGYAVGQEARGYNEYLAHLQPDDRESILLLGHMEDLLSIKGSRSYVALLNAPIVDRILLDGPGSFYRFLKEQEELARPGGGRIRKQIVAGAESPEVRACVRAEAIIGDFYMWPMLRAIKYVFPDGSHPHILDMAPIFQEAYNQLGIAAASPRLVATNQIKLLPSYAYLYPATMAGEHTKDARVRADMLRIYKESENCTRMEELLHAGLSALRTTLHAHTSELQVGGALTGDNVTLELRKRLSGVNRTNTVVETVFALEKFLSTREKGSQLINRRGWTMFKYNKTFIWGSKLEGGKLKLYGQVSRSEARRLRKEDGSVRQQLQRFYAMKADERQASLEKVRERAQQRDAQRRRLSDPLVRCTTFSGLKLLQNPELVEQLKIRKVVDGRTESNGRALVCTPPAQGGRTWMVLKLQGLLKLEYHEKKIASDPNDLQPGDLGCDSRAPRRVGARRNPGAGGRPKGKGRKRPVPEWDEDEEWPVEAILDKRVATKVDKNVSPGDILYLVAWEGWDPSYNSWEPEDNIADDLIDDYERRADEAEDEADTEEAEEAEEVAAEEAVAHSDAVAPPKQKQQGAKDVVVPSEVENTFRTMVCATLKSFVATQILEVEPHFKSYLDRWDLLVHTLTSKEDELLAFAISGSEGRGSSVLVHELHVTKANRRRGFGTALLDLCERSSTSRGRTAPKVEMRIQAANLEAQSFCLSSGFVQVREMANGGLLVMQRKR